MDWQQLETVLLDMDGTLLDLHFDNHFWLQHLPSRYSEIHGVELAKARQLLVESFARLRGSLEWYSVDYWSEFLDLDITALKNEVSHLIAVRPHVENFLARLCDSPKRLILVTNAHKKSLNLKLRITEIDRFFDDIVCAHDYASPKEEQQFWQSLQQHYQLDLQRTLFIDDSLAVLQAAEEFGIRYLYTLLQPDSQQPLREKTSYPSFLHFDEIMPPE